MECRTALFIDNRSDSEGVGFRRGLATYKGLRVLGKLSRFITRRGGSTPQRLVVFKSQSNERR